jgi:uncharacterized membrane protein YhaH (DUF805 family)
MRRRQYWYYAAASYILLPIFLFGTMLATFATGSPQATNLFLKELIVKFFIFGIFFLLIFNAIISIRRWHDLDKPSYFALLGILPLISLLVNVNPLVSFFLPVVDPSYITDIISNCVGWAYLFSFIMLGFKEGTKGDNQYGPDPKAIPDGSN